MLPLAVTPEKCARYWAHQALIDLSTIMGGTSNLIEYGGAKHSRPQILASISIRLPLVKLSILLRNMMAKP